MLNKLSIRASLTLMVAFFGVVLVIGAAAGLLSMRAGNDAMQDMYTVDTPAVADLEGSAGQLLRLRLALATYASLADLGDQTGADAVLKRFDTYLKISNDRLDHYLSLASNDDEDRRLIADMQDKRNNFLHAGVDPALAALKSGDRNGFQELQAHKLPALYNGFEKAMLALEQRQIDHGAQRYRDAQTRFKVVSVAVAVGMVFALLCAWLGRAALMRAIVHPVDSGAQRGGRSGARGRGRARLRGRGGRGALARAAQRWRGQGDQVADRRLDGARGNRRDAGRALGHDDGGDRRRDRTRERDHGRDCVGGDRAEHRHRSGESRGRADGSGHAAECRARRAGGRGRGVA